MSTIQDGLRSFDPQWGALIATLKGEGYSLEQIEKAKDDLREAVMNPQIAVSQEVQSLYSKVLPQNHTELISLVKKELLDFTEQKIREVLNGDPELAEKTLHDLLKPDSYIDSKLRLLIQLGECRIAGWYLHHISPHISDKEEEERVKAIAQVVIRNFSDGIPTFFPMMAEILYTRKIDTRTISHLSPVSDVAQSLQIVARLAELGVKNARDKLCWIYSDNEIGTGPVEVPLNLQINARIDGLWELALAGHSKSQYELGHACSSRSLGYRSGADPIPDFSETKRRSFVQELMDCEVPFNFHITSFICQNKIGELSFGLPLDTRLTMLHERANKGDENAFRSLYTALRDNKLGDDRLTFTHEERVATFKALRNYQPCLYDSLQIKMYILHRFGVTDHPLDLDIATSEEVRWLEDLALTHKNQDAQELLAKAYAQNSLRAHDDLHLPYQERLNKLKILADTGCTSAQNILLRHSGLDSHLGVITIVRDSPTSVDGVSLQFQELQLTNVVSFDDLLRWALSNYSNRAQGCLLSSIADESIKQACSFLFAVRNIVIY